MTELMALKTEFIHTNPSAPSGVVFGGNPEMRDHVMQFFAEFNKVTVYGALSEEEGIQLLHNLRNVDFVLIGGRYTVDQRIRIRKKTNERWPNAVTSEPGVDYMYGKEGILKDLTEKLNL